MTTIRPRTLADDVSAVVLPAVRFDGLCLDAVDPAAVARFWSVVLGGPVDDLTGGRRRVNAGPGRPGREFLRVNPASAGPAATTRVHVDVCLPGPTPERLLAAGAALVRLPDADPWYVLADPEGNAFCAYPAVDDRPPGIFELVVHCRDARAQARWWGDLLGGAVTAEGEAAAVTGVPTFPWDYLLFDPVPQPKREKNRLHWHVRLRDEDPAHLVAAGARVLGEPTPGRPWWVLADPEGNEFCAAPARPGEPDGGA